VAIGNNLTVAGTVAMGSSFKRNRLINGNMLIDQRNAGASVTPTVDPTYCVDRFYVGFSQASKLAVQQQTSVVPIGFTHAMKVTVASAVTPAAGDYFIVGTNIEGINTADLGFGAAGAATVTLSFQVYSSVSGTYSGVLKNGAQDRSYPFSFSVPTANTWTSVSVTIAGDTTGTWLKTISGIGFTIQWCLGGGSTYLGTAGSWVGSNRVGVTGTTNFISTVGATFYITGVQLEVGTVATPYEMQIYSDQLAQCQRYFQLVVPSDMTGAWGAFAATAQGAGTYSYKVTMRAIPTTSTPTWALTNCGAPSISSNTVNALVYVGYASAIGNASFQNSTNITASAEL
jgi:hypothetical protein